MKQEIVLRLEFDAEGFARDVKTALEKAVKVVPVNGSEANQEIIIDSTCGPGLGRITPIAK